jgi:hypothetical protein
MLVMDLAAEKPAWKAVDQPFRTRALALAQAGGKLYAIGGMTSENKMSNAVHVYDTAKGEWGTAPDMPGMAFGCSAYHLNGRVYATTFQGGLFSHAPGEEAWRDEGSMTFPRFFLRLVAVGDELAAVGGTMRGGHVRNIEWINPAQTGPEVTRVTMPAPGTAKVRQGIFFYNRPTVHRDSRHGCISPVAGDCPPAAEARPVARAATGADSAHARGSHLPRRAAGELRRSGNCRSDRAPRPRPTRSLRARRLRARPATTGCVNHAQPRVQRSLGVAPGWGDAAQ